MRYKLLPASLTEDEAARLWAHVSIGEPEDCWEWKGSRNQKEYGTFQLNGERYQATRIVMLLDGRAPAPDLLVRHRCDNPPCCNPAHLELGTVSDNAIDMWKRGRAAERALRRGGERGRETMRADPSRFARGERHGNTTLTAVDVELIRSRQHPSAELAKRFSVHRTTINRIRRGERW